MVKIIEKTNIGNHFTQSLSNIIITFFGIKRKSHCRLTKFRLQAYVLELTNAVVALLRFQLLLDLYHRPTKCKRSGAYNPLTL